jgi:hypothetical protein
MFRIVIVVPSNIKMIIVTMFGFLGFGHLVKFCKLENTRFRKLELFPPSGDLRESPAEFGPLQRS